MGSLGEIEEEEVPDLVLSLNHVSFICNSLANSVAFYRDVLGFLLIKRPSSFNFQGAWLFNYGIGIHLLESRTHPSHKGKKINPKDNHISFQTSDMNLVLRNLQKMKIDYVTAVVQEGGVKVDQLFFHDPDGYMIEICNCQNLPVLPIVVPKSQVKLSWGAEVKCCSEASDLTMMENMLSLEMMNILI